MNYIFHRLGRFDRAVFLLIIGTLLAILLVIWRGDQVGLRVIALTPTMNASDVPLHARLQIRFDQAIISDTTKIKLAFTPPLSGTVQAAGDKLIFTPDTALQPHTAYTVTLAAGLYSEQKQRLLKPVIWQFQTSQTQILYSRIDAINKEQLFIASLDLAQPGISGRLSEPRQLSFGPASIWDFTVGPAGDIVYSVLEENGSSDLWAIAPGAKDSAKLFDCQQAVCNSAAWSPDNRFLAFSKRNNSSFSAGVLSPPRLWLLALSTGQATRLFDDDQRLGFEPRWSADGEWLSYIAPDLGGVGVYNLRTKAAHFYPTTSGETGIWHPRRNQLLISVVQPIGERFTTHLVLVDLATGVQHNLSGATNLVEDNSPAWSSDGAWIAFRRKELEGPHATLGAQIWRMRADGSQATALTSDPKFDHSQLAWSPDSQHLLFQKLPLKGPDITISVWVLDVQHGQQWEVAKPGQRPVWMP